MKKRDQAVKPRSGKNFAVGDICSKSDGVKVKKETPEDPEVIKVTKKARVRKDKNINKDVKVKTNRIKEPKPKSCKKVINNTPNKIPKKPKISVTRRSKVKVLPVQKKEKDDKKTSAVEHKVVKVGKKIQQAKTMMLNDTTIEDQRATAQDTVTGVDQVIKGNEINLPVPVDSVILPVKLTSEKEVKNTSSRKRKRVPEPENNKKIMVTLDKKDLDKKDLDKKHLDKKYLDKKDLDKKHLDKKDLDKKDLDKKHLDIKDLDKKDPDKKDLDKKELDKKHFDKKDLDTKHLDKKDLAKKDLDKKDLDKKHLDKKILDKVEKKANKGKVNGMDKKRSAVVSSKEKVTRENKEIQAAKKLHLEHFTETVDYVVRMYSSSTTSDAIEEHNFEKPQTEVGKGVENVTAEEAEQINRINATIDSVIRRYCNTPGKAIHKEGKTPPKMDDTMQINAKKDPFVRILNLNLSTNERTYDLQKLLHERKEINKLPWNNNFELTKANPSTRKPKKDKSFVNKHNRSIKKKKEILSSQCSKQFNTKSPQEKMPALHSSTPRETQRNSHPIKINTNEVDSTFHPYKELQDSVLDVTSSSMCATLDNSKQFHTVTTEDSFLTVTSSSMCESLNNSRKSHIDSSLNNDAPCSVSTSSDNSVQPGLCRDLSDPLSNSSVNTHSSQEQSTSSANTSNPLFNTPVNVHSSRGSTSIADSSDPLLKTSVNVHPLPEKRSINIADTSITNSSKKLKNSGVKCYSIQKEDLVEDSLNTSPNMRSQIEHLSKENHSDMKSNNNSRMIAPLNIKITRNINTSNNERVLQIIPLSNPLSSEINQDYEYEDEYEDENVDTEDEEALLNDTESELEGIPAGNLITYDYNDYNEPHFATSFLNEWNNNLYEFDNTIMFNILSHDNIFEGAVLTNFNTKTVNTSPTKTEQEKSTMIKRTVTNNLKKNITSQESSVSGKQCDSVKNLNCENVTKQCSSFVTHKNFNSFENFPFKMPTLPPAKRPPTRVKSNSDTSSVKSSSSRCSSSSVSLSNNSEASAMARRFDSLLNIENRKCGVNLNIVNHENDDAISLYAETINSDFGTKELLADLDCQNEYLLEEPEHVVQDNQFQNIDTPGVIPNETRIRHATDILPEFSTNVESTNKIVNWLNSSQEARHQHIPSQIPFIFRDICMIHFTYETCKRKGWCNRHHKIPQEIEAKIKNLPRDKLIEAYNYAKEKSLLFKSLVNFFITAFEKLNRISDVVTLVDHILELNVYDRTPYISDIIKALQRMGLSFISAIEEIMMAQGSKNIGLSDILLYIVCVHHKQDLPKNWCVVQKLTNYRCDNMIDHHLVEDIMLECITTKNIELCKNLVRDIIMLQNVNLREIDVTKLNQFVCLLHHLQLDEEHDVIEQMLEYMIPVLPLLPSENQSPRYHTENSDNFRELNPQGAIYMNEPVNSTILPLLPSENQSPRYHSVHIENSDNFRAHNRQGAIYINEPVNSTINNSNFNAYFDFEPPFSQNLSYLNNRSEMIPTNDFDQRMHQDLNFNLRNDGLRHRTPSTSTKTSVSHHNDGMPISNSQNVVPERNRSATSSVSSVVLPYSIRNSNNLKSSVDKTDFHNNLDLIPQNTVGSNESGIIHNINSSSININAAVNSGSHDDTSLGLDYNIGTSLQSSTLSHHSSNKSINDQNIVDMQYNDALAIDFNDDANSDGSSILSDYNCAENGESSLLESDIKRLCEIITKKQILEFLVMFNTFKNLSSSSESFIVNTISFFKRSKNPLEIYDMLLNIINGLERQGDEFMNDADTKKMLYLLIVNTIAVLEHRKLYKEAAQLLLKFYGDLKNLVDTKWLRSIHVHRFSHVGKYLHFCRILLKGGYLKETVDILMSPDLKLLCGSNMWVLESHENFDLEYRNGILKETIVTALNTNVRIAQTLILHLITNKDHITEINIWKHFNKLILKLLDDSEIYEEELKSMLQNIIQGWYKHLSTPVMRGLLVQLTLSDIPDCDVMQFYKKCCKRRIYEKIKGNEKKLVLKTDMTNEEIYTTLHYLFEKIVKFNYPLQDITLNIKLAESASACPKTILNSDVGVQALKLRVYSVLACSFKFAINVNVDDQPYIKVPADQLLQYINHYKKLKGGTAKESANSFWVRQRSVEQFQHDETRPSTSVSNKIF